MMAWGFREYDNYDLIEKGRKVADVPVWYGVDKTVPMVVAQDVVRTVKKSQKGQIKLIMSYDKPVKAPVQMGQQLGVLKIEIPDRETTEVPLIAGQTINKVGLWGKIVANVKYLLTGEM